MYSSVLWFSPLCLFFVFSRHPDSFWFHTCLGTVRAATSTFRADNAQKDNRVLVLTLIQGEHLRTEPLQHRRFYFGIGGVPSGQVLDPTLVPSVISGGSRGPAQSWWWCGTGDPFLCVKNSGGSRIRGGGRFVGGGDLSLGQGPSGVLIAKK